MALGFIQLSLYIAIFWFVLIFISKQIDFEAHGFLIAPGILIWKTSHLNKLYEYVNSKLPIGKITIISTRLVLVLFFVFPLLLVANIIRIFISYPAPLLVPNPISRLTTETIILIIIPLIIVLFIHEIMHGIIADSQGVEIESSGFAVIIVFITTFVQMVPESIRKLSKPAKLHILTVPILVNLLLALILIPILSTSSILMTPLYRDPNGALVVDVITGGPADNVGIVRGNVIISIKTLILGTPTQTFNVTSANSLITILRSIPEGEEFLLVMQHDAIIISGEKPPINSKLITGSYLGIEVFDYRQPRVKFLGNFLPYWFRLEILWLININLIFGMFNLLPLPLTDGGKMMDGLFENYFGKRYDSIRKIVFSIMGALLAINILITVF